MRRRSAAVLVATVALASVARAGEPRRAVVIHDVRSSDPADVLLGYAVLGELALAGGYTLVTPLKPSDKLARAHKQIEQAEAVRQAARAQFDSLELESAVREYGKALKILDKTIAMLPDVRPLTDTLSMIGAAHLLLGQQKKANQALEKLLAIDPEYEPDETVYNPSMLHQLNELAERLQREPLAKLTVTVEPAGAAVYVDGRFAGLAPLTDARLAKGRHLVRVLSPGYESVGRTVEVKHDEQLLSLSLTPAAGNEAIEKLMAAAADAIGDDVMPDAALDISDLAGAQEVVIVAAGSPHRLVRYSNDGGKRAEQSAEAEISDAAGARRLARKLLKLQSKRERQRPEPERRAGADEQEEADRDEDKAGEPSRRERGRQAEDEEDDERADEAEGSGAGDAGPLLFLSSNRQKATILAAAYGGGALLAVTGSIFGYLALRADTKYNSDPVVEGGQVNHDQTIDQVEGKEIADSGKRNAAIADVMFGVAIVAAATGALLHVFWEPGRVEKSTAAPEGEATDGWDLFVAPGYVRVDF